MSRLRVGIVGSGFGGAVHAPAYTIHSRFEVVAIASPSSAERNIMSACTVTLSQYVTSTSEITTAPRSRAAALAVSALKFSIVAISSSPRTRTTG